MDFKKALEKLEALRACLERANDRERPMTPEESQELAIRYGGVEELILRFGGSSHIEVPSYTGFQPTVYANLIEAGYLSGRTAYAGEGYRQLLKIIGKVRQLAEDPEVLQAEPSVTSVVRCLQRFRECCQYLQDPPTSERDVQDIVWIMLRSQHDRVDREDQLPRFGVKAYRPDFGLPDLRLLVEVKFIGSKTDVAEIQEEILADIPGYLQDTGRWSSVLVLVYDHAQKLRDPRKFLEAVKSVDGIVDAIVIPGVGSSPQGRT